MNVPAGYKATEVGVIPVDWEVSTVGEQFHIQLGKMLDAERNRGLPKPYIGNRAVRWGKIDTAELETVPMSASDLSRYRLKTGDILVCEGGEVGRSAIWKGELPDCYYQKALHRLRAKGAYNSELLIEVLYQASVNGGFTNFVSQTSIAHLTKEKFATFPIPKPDEAEQSAIAEALSDVDEAIAAQEAVIAKKRALKTATMQALLSGTRRLPGFSGAWELKALGQSLKVRHGKSQASVETINGNYPILATGGEIGRANDYLHPGPSVLIGRKGTIDRPQYSEGPFWSIDTLFYTEIDTSAEAKYLFYRFQMIDWRTFNEASGVPSLSSTTIEAIEVEMPKRDEQTAIASTITEFDLDLEQNSAKLTKLRHLKTGMMQQLLTGKIRLV